MSTEDRPRYPHRRNWDGSYDAICPRCFQTIGKRHTESELVEDERLHVCEEWRLAQPPQKEKPVSPPVH